MTGGCAGTAFFLLGQPSFCSSGLNSRPRQVELLAGIDHQSCNSPIPDDQVKENTQIIQMTRFCSGEATDTGFSVRYETKHTKLKLTQTLSCRAEGFSAPAFVADTGDGVGVRCTSDASDAPIALEIAARLTSSRDVDPLLQLDVEPSWDFGKCAGGESGRMGAKVGRTATLSWRGMTTRRRRCVM